MLDDYERKANEKLDMYYTNKGRFVTVGKTS